MLIPVSQEIGKRFMAVKTQAYATLRHGMKDGVRAIFYGIYFDVSKQPLEFKGPYRDKTDAENAAEDEAKQSNLELTWVY